jgi:hypothetical protein
MRGSHRRSTYQAIAARPILGSLVGAAAVVVAAAAVGRGRPGRPLATFLRAGAVALTGKALIAGVLRR